jgi:hypothetical protein
MGWPLRIGATALAATMLAGGAAGFALRASEHPNVEPSVGAGCVGCHLTDYRAADHHVGDKPTTCGACHAQEGWKPTHFDHPFELTGKHATITCFKCHVGDPPVFHGTANDCIACHRAEYEGARDHVGHFSMACHDCHSFDAWKPADYTPPEPPPLPTPTLTVTTPPPPPTVTAKPKPKPIPTATATATASVTTTATVTATATATATDTVIIPDIITRPSGHHH